MIENSKGKRQKAKFKVKSGDLEIPHNIRKIYQSPLVPLILRGNSSGKGALFICDCFGVGKDPRKDRLYYPRKDRIIILALTV